MYEVWTKVLEILTKIFDIPKDWDFDRNFKDINWAKIIEDSTISTIIVDILTNIFKNYTEDILLWKWGPLHNREMKYQHAWRSLAGLHRIACW